MSTFSGSDRRIGFVTSGPAFMHVRETFPTAPVLKLGFSCPPPLDKIRAFAGQVDTLVVVEETEPLLETEIRAAGLEVHGKDLLPRFGELAPGVLRPAIKPLLGEPYEVPKRPQSRRVPPPADHVRLLPASRPLLRPLPHPQPQHHRRHRLLHPRRRPSLERAGYLHLHGRLAEHGPRHGQGARRI
jgi:TPP-dependent indolepyruvate ferredoxin oxidoreductase alpha subunit